MRLLYRVPKIILLSVKSRRWQEEKEHSTMRNWKKLFGANQPSTSGKSAAQVPLSAPDASVSASRRIRVFISSTFRDMIEERDELMSQTWPQLRKLCQERHVELVEVDLRWGIAESQSTRKETLKLCLDEIRACRPFFIGLLGERYGWTPGDDAFTADLKEEQPWLKDLHGKSVTEMEILHGVLNNPDMAGRAFFYFRNPAYVKGRGPDFLSETTNNTDKQTALKTLIRTACTAKKIPLRENYPDPKQLAAMVLTDLTAAIEEQYPKENIPDPLTREAQDHEAFAEIRRRTYIGRADYFQALDRHAAGDGSPLVLLGDSGSGKSALLANWIEHWRKAHPQDFIFQHYIGGTSDSADHWRLMTRLISEIKHWSDDPDPVPTSHDDLLRDFPLWLAKARARAEHKNIRFILVFDALNQLTDQDHARLLGWLPEHPFAGPLRLIVSAMPGDTLVVAEKRGWGALRIQPLTVDERGRMINDYLARFGKKLDDHRLNRLASAEPAANPLYLKILLDDLRVTGTHERLDERLSEYLTAADIPALLKQVLARWQRDYERDRPGLVGETLSLIYAARRGLSETELLQLLAPCSNSVLITHNSSLPPALWAPLRAALEDSLVDRGGILNFAHDYLRTAVETLFVSDLDKRDDLQLQLADYFEAQIITARTCDELPWLLKETDSRVRLRSCLLDIDRFLLMRDRDANELLGYWVEQLHEQQTMGKDYLGKFLPWSQVPGRETQDIAFAANRLGLFLSEASLNVETEPLYRIALEISEQDHGEDGSDVAACLNNLAMLLVDTNRFAEAEPLLYRALQIDEQNGGENCPDVARDLGNLALLLHATNRLAEAEPLCRRALKIAEQSYGRNHPKVAVTLNNLAMLLRETNRLADAEILLRRALEIDEQSYGKNHPEVAIRLSSLGQLFYITNQLATAEPLLRRALQITEQSYGEAHPRVARDLSSLAALLLEANRLIEAESLCRRALWIFETSLGREHPDVATQLCGLAKLLQNTGRYTESEPLYRRALEIHEQSHGKNHRDVGRTLSSLGMLLVDTNRFAEAEPLLRRALQIVEQSFGENHPEVASARNNLATVFQRTNRLVEAEPLLRRTFQIYEQSYGENHPNVAAALNNLAVLFQATNRPKEAEPLFRRALEITEQSCGKDHPAVAEILNNLAALFQVTRRLKEAEPLRKRSLFILFRASNEMGSNHPDVVLCATSYRLLSQDLQVSQHEIDSRLHQIMIQAGLKNSRFKEIDAKAKAKCAEFNRMTKEKKATYDILKQLKAETEKEKSRGEGLKVEIEKKKAEIEKEKAKGERLKVDLENTKAEIERLKAEIERTKTVPTQQPTGIAGRE